MVREIFSQDVNVGIGDISYLDDTETDLNSSTDSQEDGITKTIIQKLMKN